MRLSMNMGTRQTLRHRLQLTQGQRIDFRLSLRSQILQALHEDDYTPKASCPRCKRELKPREILEGFLDDPNDFTTKCTNEQCGHRFAPQFVMAIRGGRVELPFYCSAQVLGMLDDHVGKSWEELERSQRAMVESARFHFGTVTNAFAQIGKEYEGEPDLHWSEKIQGFLGEVPDTLIAECVGKSSTTVRRLRNKLGIAPFKGYTE